MNRDLSSYTLNRSAEAHSIQLLWPDEQKWIENNDLKKKRPQRRGTKQTTLLNSNRWFIARVILIEFRVTNFCSMQCIYI